MKKVSLSYLKEMVMWGGFIGWQGATCFNCKSTHNLFCGIPGFMCRKCGKYNILSWSHWQMTHGKPDFGWGRKILCIITKNFCWYKEYLV